MVISRLPLWFRYLVAAVCSIALFAGLVVFVSSHNTADSTPAKLGGATVTQQLNQLSTALLTQEEAPRIARVPAGVAPAAVLRRAVRAAVVTLEGEGDAQGPITSVTCARRSGPPSRLVYGCTVVAANVNYPFDAVIQPSDVTYCRVDPSLVDGHTVPVSSRCR
jgi:hypothetical protein